MFFLLPLFFPSMLSSYFFFLIYNHLPDHPCSLCFYEISFFHSQLLWWFTFKQNWFFFSLFLFRFYKCRRLCCLCTSNENCYLPHEIRKREKLKGSKQGDATLRTEDIMWTILVIKKWIACTHYTSWHNRWKPSGFLSQNTLKWIEALFKCCSVSEIINFISAYISSLSLSLSSVREAGQEGGQFEYRRQRERISPSQKCHQRKRRKISHFMLHFSPSTCVMFSHGRKRGKNISAFFAMYSRNIKCSFRNTLPALISYKLSYIFQIIKLFHS